ncbi:uncharacterized protein LOC132259474 [Phlebotomus argentipes]|uniref:uncharacterized protein LOC132259474 n=1 Tax=Phlebotomus argentipes TaxID=94469 RepID=UPI0028934D3B|nr:uncharacterized protein LOC132259474 [Phlebotomus argentipes]
MNQPRGQTGQRGRGRGRGGRGRGGRGRGIPENTRPSRPFNSSTPRDIQALRNLNLSRRETCTHFISIPFKDESLKKSFEDFRNDLIQNLDKYRINENIIQKSPKLHKTIINLTLTEQKDIDLAKKTLEGEKEALKEILKSDTQEKHVIVKGLQEPRNLMFTSDIYANITSSVISKITDHLIEAFEREKMNMLSGNPVGGRILLINKGLLTDETMKRINYSFNPGPLLQNYRDHEFGKLDIKEIHLSRRHKYDADGYYEAETVVQL